ncbi:MAG: flagellar assembly protein FliW [Lentisphaeraceae bacterium]|nr:flagellar assembly protein FliW [Lentisphaeraceae bacterium]
MSKKTDKNKNGNNKIILGLTPYDGELIKSLGDDAVITFKDGVPAFEEAKKFTLFTNDEIKPFMYLKSLELEELGFVCIDPFLINKDYLIKISGTDLAQLGLKKPESALVFCFVTVRPDPQENTANLLAPVIVNLENRKAKQIILENNPVRFNIWEGLEKVGEK